MDVRFEFTFELGHGVRREPSTLPLARHSSESTVRLAIALPATHHARSALVRNRCRPAINRSIWPANWK